MVKDIMDVKEIAAYLGFSPTKIYRMLTAGEIPFIKVGGQYRFPKRVIDEWLAGKLEVPGEVASPATQSRNDGITRPKGRARNDGITRSGKLDSKGRAEDGIVDLLLKFAASKAASDKRKAKDLIKKNIGDLDWNYLADIAAGHDVREEAIDLIEEIEKET